MTTTTTGLESSGPRPGDGKDVFTMSGRDPALGKAAPAFRPARALAALLLTLALPTVGAQTLRVLTHSSFDLPAETLEAFTERTGIAVELLPAGDAGEALNRAILTKGRPLGDVLFGIDDSLLARALEAGIFEPYESEALAAVPEAYRFDPSHHVTPIDVGFVAFNYDRAYFAAAGRAAPQDLTDLTTEPFRGLTVVADPASSSPGLAFMLTTIARFGEGGEYDWLDYWAELRANDLLVTSGWSDAYYTSFTRYGGDRPIVLSYATSPAAEVIFAGEPLDEAPTANLLCELCAWRQVEAAGVLAGASNPEAARLFIDFLLSEEVQAEIPLAMFVYPARSGVPLPAEFDLYAELPAPGQAASLPSDRIAENTQRWLEQWTAVVRQGRDPATVR